MKVEELKEKKICVVCGGQSSEREVSLMTGSAVYNALTAKGYNAVILDLNFDNMNQIADTYPDVCFNALHGKVGEDGILQRFLDEKGILYTGTGAEACSISFDKQASKERFIAEGVPTPEYVIVESASDIDGFLPCVVKPAKEGSTVGISIVKEPGEAEKSFSNACKYDKKVIAERFIKGKELTIAVFEGEIFPPIWIKPKSGFYDYKSKYTKGATEYLFELELNDNDIELVKSTALKAYNALGCEGVARVDIIFDGEVPYVLEVNTAPGMTETSLLPNACRKAGVDFISLVEKMLLHAFDKNNEK